MIYVFALLTLVLMSVLWGVSNRDLLSWRATLNGDSCLLLAVCWTMTLPSVRRN